MLFAEALKIMKGGRGVKLPSWGGYWWWDEESQTILMYTKDGGCMDIRETQNVEYTIQNILSDEWIVADGQNCPILGGEATFSFGEAIKYLKRGMKVARERLEWQETVHSACFWNFLQDSGRTDRKLRA
ncbi:MAG: hypothetical protein ACLVBP_16275 [Ruminococcus sp.]